MMVAEIKYNNGMTTMIQLAGVGWWGQSKWRAGVPERSGNIGLAKAAGLKRMLTLRFSGSCFWGP